jgi:hypothetical protein
VRVLRDESLTQMAWPQQQIASHDLYPRIPQRPTIWDAFS